MAFGVFAGHGTVVDPPGPEVVGVVKVGIRSAGAAVFLASVPIGFGGVFDLPADGRVPAEVSSVTFWSGHWAEDAAGSGVTLIVEFAVGDSFLFDEFPDVGLMPV